MIYELPREAYGRVRPLFQRMDEHLAVSAILNGAIATNIWVDDLRLPAHHAYPQQEPLLPDGSQ